MGEPTPAGHQQRHQHRHQPHQQQHQQQQEGSARLVSSLRVGPRAREVILDQARLLWRDPQPPARGGGRECCSVPTSEIIAVEETEIEEKQSNRGKWLKVAKPQAFTVHYVKRGRHHRWRCKEVTFWCLDDQLRRRWIQALKASLDSQTSRPKQLLVYINPFGGRRQGRRIYERKIAPLFSLASISTDVVVTEHANHARDNVYEVNLEKYDGVVCVGGDGMFSELMHGLLGRIQKESGIDQNNPQAPLVQCDLRIGIIPAGSTDCVCFATVGINDPVTSALHIIVGDSQPLDVSSVHRDGRLLKYFVSLMGYGFYGDVLKDSEEKRWMGAVRYDLSGLKAFFSHQYYEGTISLLPATHTEGSPRDKRYCRAGCDICEQSKQRLEEQRRKHRKEINEEEGGEWKVIRGKFLAINAANMCCACPRSVQGLSPGAHLADGCADLVVVRKCSRLNFLRYLVRHTNREDQFNFAFVDVFRVRRFRFTSKHFQDSGSCDPRKKRLAPFCRDHPACGCQASRSTWNCDGETLASSAIEVKVHCQLLRLFARGIEPDSEREPA